jgi:hypothetical protein
VKRCYKCKKDKPLGDFPENRKRADGHGSMCKSCKKSYNAVYYTETKDRHNPARAARRRRVRNEARRNVFEYLSTHPCADCGETDIVVLDFDHQGDKTEEINAMIAAGKPWTLILAEIEKCEVVCSNDHRRRTAKTFGWYRAVMASGVANLTGQRTGLLIRAISVRTGGGARACTPTQSGRPQKAAGASSSLAAPTPYPLAQPAAALGSEPRGSWFESREGSFAAAHGLRLRLRAADGPVRPRVAAPGRSCRNWQTGTVEGRVDAGSSPAERTSPPGPTTGRSL